MNKLIRQVSIESPSHKMGDCVLNFVVPVPDTPPTGARVLVCYAGELNVKVKHFCPITKLVYVIILGACYRKNQSSSISSIGSFVSDTSDVALNLHILAQQMKAGTLPALSEESTDGTTLQHQTSLTQPFNAASHYGVRDGALFPGYEVAGVIETLGSGLGEDCGFKVGQRVVLYPYEGVPHGYSELIVVPEIKYLIPIPDSLPLSIAATLPSGALQAQSAVLAAHKIIDELIAQRKATNEKGICKILIVGTGGLALWAIRLASQHFYKGSMKENVQITVASLRDEGFMLAKKCEK
jgi:hypothetical protein